MSDITGSPTGGKIILNPLMYRDLQPPEGFLHMHPACHALWHYYLLAANNLNEQATEVVYEDQDDPKYDYRQLFQSVAKLYGVEPENMINFWSNVDMQAVTMGFPKLKPGYRFDNKLQVNTNAN